MIAEDGLAGSTALAVEEPAPAGSPPRRVRPWQWETALVVALSALTFAVHDVAYVLSQPYWTDEAWVAASTKYPMTDLRDVTASTPIGWTALLRIFVVGGAQRQRIEPLLFAALTVAAAYLLARQLRWSSRSMAMVAGAVAGFAALTVPAMLTRNDLKQYTADAALSLIVLGLTARLEREWSRRRLAQLCVATPVGMLFSDAVVIVGVASLLAVGVVLLIRRRWTQLRDTAIGAAGCGICVVGIYALFVAPAQTSWLMLYWRSRFVPIHQGFHASITMIATTFHLARGSIGLGPSWLVILLFLGGLGVIARRCGPMLAIAVAVLTPEMIALSALRKYPLFDQRTSTFFLVVVAVVAAIGVFDLAVLIARRSVAAGGLVLLAAMAASLSQTHHALRVHSIPDEDVRSQVAYLTDNRAAGDVIVVNSSGNWGFGYYWKHNTPSRRRDHSLGWQVQYPLQTRIVVATGRSGPAISAALRAGLALRATTPGARVWLVLSHDNDNEKRLWKAVLRNAGVSARPVDAAGLKVIG